MTPQVLEMFDQDFSRGLSYDDDGLDNLPQFSFTDNGTTRYAWPREIWIGSVWAPSFFGIADAIWGIAPGEGEGASANYVY